MAEENEVESEEMDKGNMPSNEILVEMFEAIVGEELDESNERHIMAMIVIYKSFFHKTLIWLML